MKGELFFPRKILEAHILADGPSVDLPNGQRTDLTRREREVLQMLATGMPNRDIAVRLCISPHTVKTHIYKLYKKINVTNRYQAVHRLLEQSGKL
jgi:LuxR family transcriptional regulator of csgAB operon